MRISDWSSDVCSSDLACAQCAATAADVVVASASQYAGARRGGGLRDCRHVVRACDAAGDQSVAPRVAVVDWRLCANRLGLELAGRFYLPVHHAVSAVRSAAASGVAEEAPAAESEKVGEGKDV